MHKAQISSKQAEDFFQLYKQIVESDFKEWSAESKTEWLTDKYSLNFWKVALENGLPVLVAFDDKKMVGYVALESITFGVAYLGWIGVLKEYRKNKLGTQLMKEMVNWCIKNGLHKIELETQKKELLPFFEKLGYVLEGIRKNSWQHLDNYMFGKTLQ